MIAQAKAGIRRLLPKNHFARGVSVLAGGTAGSQVLLVLASPLLTRLYGPDDFGLLAVYASLLAIIGVVASLRYELAIPLPEDDVEAANVAALSLLLVLITAALTGVVVLLLSGPISAALGVPALGPYLWLLPIGVLVAGAYKVFNYWAVRTKRFSTIAGTKLRQAIATIGIQLVGFKLGSVALLLGQVAGQGVGTTTLGLPALKSVGLNQITLRGVVKAAKRYRRFPIFSTWAGLANTSGLQLPPMLFAVFFGPAVVGLYSLAHRVLTLPMSLVGHAIGQVFFANAAEAHRGGQLAPLVVRMHAKLSHIGLPAILVIFLIGPDIFAVVFGEQWRRVGEIARWMAPWLYFQFVSSPLSAAVFSATESQQYMLVFQVVMLFFRILAIAAGVIIDDFTIAVIIFSIASSLSYVGLLLLMSWLSGARAKEILRPTLTSLLLGSLMAAPVLVIFAIPDLSLIYVYAGYFLTFGLLFGRYLMLYRDMR